MDSKSTGREAMPVRVWLGVPSLSQPTATFALLLRTSAETVAYCPVLLPFDPMKLGVAWRKRLADQNLYLKIKNNSDLI